MSLLMSNDEICRDYRLSKNKNQQVKVLAELNETTPGEILAILTAGGEISGTPQQKAAAKAKPPAAQKEAESKPKRTPVELRLEQYVGLADKGFTVAETAEALGVTPGAVWSFAKKHGIRFAGMRNEKKKQPPAAKSRPSGKANADAQGVPSSAGSAAGAEAPKEAPRTGGVHAEVPKGSDMVEAMRQLLYLMPEIVGGDAAVTACSANRSTAVVIAETGGRCWRLSLTEEGDGNTA